MIHPIDCKTCRAWLHGDLDNELETNAAAEVAEHRRHCAECAREYADAQRLVAQLRAHMPHYQAPAGLAQRLRASLEAPAPPREGGLQRWLGGGQSALAGPGVFNPGAGLVADALPGRASPTAHREAETAKAHRG